MSTAKEITTNLRESQPRLNKTSRGRIVGKVINHLGDEIMRVFRVWRNWSNGFVRK
jgi:hypothetical protein